MIFNVGESLNLIESKRGVKYFYEYEYNIRISIEVVIQIDSRGELRGRVFFHSSEKKRRKKKKVKLNCF